MRYSWVLFLLCATNLWAFDGRENRDFEKRLNSIYKSSYSTEVSDQEWANYVEKIESETYEVRAGDTLWDLSKVFFGDGFFWSKIWSYNEKLTNPHMISVGSQLNFFSGSLTSPPALGVNGQSAPQGSMKITRSEAPKSSGGLYPDAPDLPPSMSKVSPVLNQIPPAFQGSSDDGNTYDAKGMSFDLRPPVRMNPLYTPSAFFTLAGSEYPNFGKVVEAEDGEFVVGRDKQIYVESERGLSVGQKFTVLGKDFELSGGGVSGYVVQYQGVAQVVDVLPDNIYRAHVIQSLNPVALGAWVTDESIPHLPDNHNGRTNNVSLEIIGGAFEKDRRIFGRGSVVFLNGGTNDGLAANDILGVYKVRDRRFRKAEIDVSPRPIAKIKIYRAETESASAFVLSSSEAIMKGDKTGAPGDISAPMSKAGPSDLNSIEDAMDDGEDSETL